MIDRGERAQSALSQIRAYSLLRRLELIRLIREKGKEKDSEGKEEGRHSRSFTCDRLEKEHMNLTVNIPAPCDKRSAAPTVD